MVIHASQLVHSLPQACSDVTAQVHFLFWSQTEQQVTSTHKTEGTFSSNISVSSLNRHASPGTENWRLFQQTLGERQEDTLDGSAVRHTVHNSRDN